MKYEIYFAKDELGDRFTDNVFNIKKDLKSINVKSKEAEVKIVQELSAELQRGFGRNSCINLFEKDISTFKIIIAKIRVSYNNSSKRDALRCILLVDQVNSLCIILHIYAKNKKTDLENYEYQALKKMLEEYYIIIKENENE